MSTSRELANNMRKLADWLDSRPEFPLNRTDVYEYSYFCCGEKDVFLQAVRALGAGKKVNDGDSIRFEPNTPDGTRISFEIKRSAVCRLVRPAQEAVYDCEPLLSQAEEAELEAK